VVLIIATVAVAACSDYLVDSVDGFVETLHVSRAFIGLIIVPIVGNAGEYATTVKWAMNNKLDLAIGVIVGSTLQIALFVTPFMVILGWIIGEDMSLRFDRFQTTTVSLSVLVVNALVRDGRTNYFEGFLLIAT
jgi:Ca2+:H+ antiporter